MLAPVRVAAPAILPISLAEAKAHLRVDHDDDDALIEGLVGATTDHLDGWTGILGRCLVEQDWRQDFDGFAHELCLPLGPVISVASVTWRDAAGTLSTVSPSAYDLRSDAGGRSLVRFDADYSFPSGLHESRAVAVTYRAGYATIPAGGEMPATSTVPPALKVAILLLAAHWYENREAVAPATMRELPIAVAALVAPYRRIGV